MRLQHLGAVVREYVEESEMGQEGALVDGNMPLMFLQQQVWSAV